MYHHIHACRTEWNGMGWGGATQYVCVHSTRWRKLKGFTWKAISSQSDFPFFTLHFAISAVPFCQMLLRMAVCVCVCSNLFVGFHICEQRRAMSTHFTIVYAHTHRHIEYTRFSQRCVSECEKGNCVIDSQPSQNACPPCNGICLMNEFQFTLEWWCVLISIWCHHLR